MEWGFIVIMALAIVGAALVAGGVVAYKGSVRVRGRSLAVAGIAVGVVMWGIVIFSAPVSVSEGDSPGPAVTEAGSPGG